MSYVAVDMLTYINASIPFTAENIKSGLRRRGDHRKFVSLPSQKFRLPSEDAGDVGAQTKESRVWLKEVFGIVYEDAAPHQVDTSLAFEDGYVNDMLVALKRSSPTMRKLIYGYIRERKTDESLIAASQCNLEAIERHIVTEYPWSVRLPYKGLTFVYRIVNPLFEWLRKFQSVRWLRSRCKTQAQ